MLLTQNLQKLWLTEKQSEIFILLYKFGAKPASSIAKNIWWERTNTYKYLETMVRKWLIAETRKAGVKQFYVADKKIFRNLLENKKKEVDENLKILPMIESELKKFDEQKVSPIPQMRFFEWKSWIKNMFSDLFNAVKTKKYLVLKMFASNTLESQSLSQFVLWDYTKNILKDIENEWVSIEAYLWNWIMILESIFKTNDINEISWLPAGSSNINVFILWDLIYIVIFKNIPFGFKIESEEFSSMFHFLLKKTNN